MHYSWNVGDTLRKAGHSVSVLFLSYDLAPEQTYPRQLQQAVALLHHVIYVLRKKPSDIILFGDSAGGNLCLGILSHVSHPHLDIPVLDLPSNFLGVLLVAPWVTFDVSSTPDGSMLKNECKDMVTNRALSRWAREYLGGAKSDFYNEPLTAPADWWDGAKADNILVVVGGDEILLDSVKAIAKNLERVEGTKTTMVIVPKEGHISMFVDPAIGYRVLGQQASVAEQWLKAKL
ncbi:MAG: hypothetical protein M1832_001598 [Thelocarpon impressellum]|nr:MAG: hypothetical protein M1832_001598 [Thelocarpon impressellum]